MYAHTHFLLVYKIGTFLLQKCAVGDAARWHLARIQKTKNKNTDYSFFIVAGDCRSHGFRVFERIVFRSELDRSATSSFACSGGPFHGCTR